jgi:Icc protein
MRIAHISDLHLLEPDLRRRPAAERVRLAYLSLLRPIDVHGRMRSAARALETAKTAGFDHLVVSGDLTEDGKPAQFEQAARVLAESGIAPERVTLVPGNHDVYEDAGAWQRALAGPLARYSRTSVADRGRLIDLGEIALVALSTAVHQHWTVSSGLVQGGDLDLIEKHTADPAFRHNAVVLVQHHPPLPERARLVEWIDGLRDYARIAALLARQASLQVLHGHMHKLIDRVLEIGGSLRIFGAPGVVEEVDPKVRLYETRAGALVPV